MSAITEFRLLKYPFPSYLTDVGRTRKLCLATFRDGRESTPFFFEGKLLKPKRTAEMLRSIMMVVQSRFHIPAAMLSRILAESDPVVTCNDDLLRFEGFSACCGVYVRTDLLPAAFHGKVHGRGTTNVDFNPPMLSALARIKSGDDVSLAVGADKVVLKQMANEVVEKKVTLPIRWMKGFVEVQAVQSRMQHVHQVNGIQAFRFLRSLPRVKTHRRATFVTAAGSGLRLSQVETSGAVRVGGLERLRVLESLARKAEQLDVYADPLTGASGWVLSFSDCLFHLVISPEVWRGFSGEGQALDSLTAANKADVPRVRARLKWQSVIDRSSVAKSTGLSDAAVDAALNTLGTRGLVGFDLQAQSWFHREMPFDVSQVEKLQPRLIAARKLLDEQKVRLHDRTQSAADVRVQSSDVEHRVTVDTRDEVSYKCTCPWFNKHKNERGPCKHILAARILLDGVLEESM